MPKFPSYRFPNQYYRPYNYKPQPYYHTPIQQAEIQPYLSPSEPTHPPPKKKADNPVWFDLFGIKLYFDDVLILSLLFFLYKEEVKDEGLFLALVLLLIS